ncbi:hypothetical protein, partial [Enterobacter sichuanensis]
MMPVFLSGINAVWWPHPGPHPQREGEEHHAVSFAGSMEKIYAGSSITSSLASKYSAMSWNKFRVYYTRCLLYTKDAADDN